VGQGTLSVFGAENDLIKYLGVGAQIACVLFNRFAVDVPGPHAVI